MELMSGVCTFCEENDSILKPKSASLFLNLASKTLFGNDENEPSQFQSQWRNVKLCLICAYKIEMAHDFVEQYKRNATKKSPNRKQTAFCFLCERPSNIIAANLNPYRFSDKFRELTDVFVTAKDHKDCFVCTYCIFALNSWHNLRNTLLKEIFTQNDVSTLMTHGNEARDEFKGALKLTFSYCSDGKMRVRQKDSSTSPKLQKHLKECLRNHVPLKSNKNLKLNYETNDTKILDKVPYVLIDRKKSVLEKKRPAVLPIKIKMSPKFLTTVKPAKVTPKTQKKSPNKGLNKTPSKSPKIPATPPKLKKVIYRCSECDITFKRNYLYQEHNLNHVKPDRLVVRVARSEFSKLNNTQSDVSSVSEDTIEGQEEIKQIQETVEDEKCASVTENSNNIDELNNSDEQYEKDCSKSENEFSNSTCSSTQNDSEAQQDDKIDSTNNEEFDQKEAVTVNDISKHNGDSSNGDILPTDTVSKDSCGDENSDSGTIGSENVDSNNTSLVDEESVTLKRKFSELNETTDSNEDSSLKYPPRKKVRFACDIGSENADDEICPSDKEDLTDTESVDTLNECE